jgi:ATP phosphoribosyltransferase regulatory subunit
MRFTLYAKSASDALVRGGRYDEVGAVFGRNRPAAGFSLDLKQLVGAVPKPVFKASIRTPWVETAEARAAVAALRASGETVVCSLPGRSSQADELFCDRELAYVDGRWIVQAV